MRYEQDFQADLEFGHKGEELVQKLLLEKGIKTTRTQGKCNYDLLSSRNKKIDVKYDRYYHTGNICLELWSDKYYRSKGWLQKDIDALAYIFADKEGVPHEVILYNMKVLQYLFLTCWSTDNTWDGIFGLRLVDAVNNGNCNVENILIPKSWLNVTNPFTLYKLNTSEHK